MFDSAFTTSFLFWTLSYKTLCEAQNVAFVALSTRYGELVNSAKG